MQRILLVCLGNICRSPMAEAIFQDALTRSRLSHRIEVDSAAISRSHAKEKPDSRAIQCAKAAGYTHIEQIRSRPVEESDFDRFDVILAMDESVLRALQRKCPPSSAHKLDLFLRYAQNTELTEVPDPYYGNTDGFSKVLHLCIEGVEGILKRLIGGTH